jgi:hypothetical protein
MSIKKLFGAGIVAGALAFSSVAGAAVTYDPATGGFAGKGDVQLALTMNNAQLQAAAESLTFTYDDTVTYLVPCKKDNGRLVLTNTYNRTSAVTGTVAYDSRKRNQVNGFELAPITNSTPVGSISCPNGWEADGDPVLVGSSGGGLFVNDRALQ